MAWCLVIATDRAAAAASSRARGKRRVLCQLVSTVLRHTSHLLGHTTPRPRRQQRNSTQIENFPPQLEKARLKTSGPDQGPLTRLLSVVVYGGSSRTRTQPRLHPRGNNSSRFLSRINASFDFSVMTQQLSSYKTRHALIRGQKIKIKMH